MENRNKQDDLHQTLIHASNNSNTIIVTNNIDDDQGRKILGKSQRNCGM